MAATHAGKEAWLEGSEPRRDVAEQKHQKLGRVWAAMSDVPHNVVDPHRKTIAYAAKVGFVVGDTAVLADQLNRSGSSLLLAILVGLALAVTVVMVGTQCGHEVGAANHRKLRGSAPEDSPIAVRTFFDSGDAELSYSHWLHLAIAAGLTMFLALFFLGVGSGDPAKLALGYGLLGSLTVAGSACAEAYATNDAADHLKAADNGMKESGDALAEFESAEHDSAAARTTASLTETGARHTAVATETTVVATANRIPDTPEIGGYIDGGHIPQPQSAPLPVEIPVVAVDTPSSGPRSRKRPSLSIEPERSATSEAESDWTDDPGTPDSSAEAAPTTFVPVHLAEHRLNGSKDQVVS